MNMERVWGREDGQGNGSKGETKAECKKWCKNCETLLRDNIDRHQACDCTKTADEKTIINYHTHSQTRKTIIDYHEKFEQAQNE